MLPTQTMAAMGLNFVHRRVVGAIGGFFTGGLPGAAVGFAKGGPGSSTTTAIGTRTVTAGTLPISRQSFEACGPGFRRDASGRCARTGLTGAVQRFLPGGESGFAPVELGGPGTDEFGVAVMGSFGAALEPAQMPATRLRCPRGTVLGRDDLCYNKRDLRKSERKWPPGTKPVLTGGQVNTLRKAQRIQGRLVSLGLSAHHHHPKPRKRKKLISH